MDWQVLHNPFCTSFNGKRTKDRHLTPWLENREKLNDISTRALSDLPVPLNIGIVQYELEFRYLDRVWNGDHGSNILQCIALDMAETQGSICFMSFSWVSPNCECLSIICICSYSAVSPHFSNLIQPCNRTLVYLCAACIFTTSLTYLCHKYQLSNNLRSAMSTRPSLKLTTCGNEERAGQIQLKTQQILRRAQTFPAALHL